MVLIEQVARAICCARHRCEECKGNGEGGCFDLELWDEEARAALTTMQDREATLMRERDALREIISFADEALIPLKGEWAKQTRQNIAKQLDALGTSGLAAADDSRRAERAE